jgi:2-iminobutanoate/2-iminopropanoate deaminase
VRQLVLVSVAVGPYSPVIRAGDWVYLSGQLGLADGVVVEGGVKAEVVQIFANARGLLAKAGAGLGHVVKCTVFLTSMDDFATMNEVYVTEFERDAPGHRPARSTVGNTTLARDASVEIEFIAYTGAGGIEVPS